MFVPDKNSRQTCLRMVWSSETAGLWDIPIWYGCITWQKAVCRWWKEKGEEEDGHCHWLYRYKACVGNVKHVGGTSLAYQLFSFSDFFFLMFKIVCWPAFRVYFRIYAHHLKKMAQTASHVLHPGKLTCLLKRDQLNRKYIFQPLIFRGRSLVFGGVDGFLYIHPY